MENRVNVGRRPERPLPSNTTMSNSGRRAAVRPRDVDDMRESPVLDVMMDCAWTPGPGRRAARCRRGCRLRGHRGGPFFFRLPGRGERAGPGRGFAHALKAFRSEKIVRL